MDRESHSNADLVVSGWSAGFATKVLVNSRLPEIQIVIAHLIEEFNHLLGVDVVRLALRAVLALWTTLNVGELNFLAPNTYIELNSSSMSLRGHILWYRCRNLSNVHSLG